MLVEYDWPGNVRELKSVLNKAMIYSESDIITPDDLRERGLAKKRSPIKILGEGEIDRALTVHAHSFSLGAVEKIKAAGGSVEVVGK